MTGEARQLARAHVRRLACSSEALPDCHVDRGPGWDILVGPGAQGASAREQGGQVHLVEECEQVER